MSIKLLCDSLCDIPEEIASKDYLDIIPLTVIFEDGEFREGVDINKQEFYNRVKASGEIPKTSQATYVEFKNAFDRYISEGNQIICITGSSKSSGTYQSAMLAKSDTEGDVHVFDTLSLSLGAGQFVIKACELIEDGFGYDEIIDELENIRESVHLIFVPSTLEYLKKSGRVRGVTALLGNLLNIKPIFHMADGEIKLIEKVRGAKRVPSKMIDILSEFEGGVFEDKIVTIGCGDNINDVKGIEDEVKKRIKAKKVMFTRGGVCICSHTGPDIIAVSCSR